MSQESCSLPPQLLERLRNVRLLALDVDGVLSDGQLYFDSNGTEIKSFHVLDGHGLKLAKRVGIDVALITGRKSPMVAQHLLKKKSIRILKDSIGNTPLSIRILVTSSRAKQKTFSINSAMILN